MNKKIYELALNNIYFKGDTDVFPFPIENFIFKDKQIEVIDLLSKINKDFKNWLDEEPPMNIDTLAPIGYTGYRWVTHIDPIWNAYLLSLVISIGDKIETKRIEKNRNIVHSYRFSPDSKTHQLFDDQFGWKSFQETSLKIIESEEYKFVVVCDIADFYNRIYHHRLENGLEDVLGKGNQITSRIIELLTKFTTTKSYGLPIGGNAARILAELALNSIDKILTLNGIKFTRFVDDIHLFAKSQEEAHSILNFLAIKLMSNEGLTLQKHKTQILTKSEFKKLVQSLLSADSDDKETSTRAKFMKLPIRYDPYSLTASEDYEKIKKELSQFDVVDLLTKELNKSRIHQTFSKRLIQALQHYSDEIASQAVNAITDRIELLYPIFPNLMIVLSSIFDKLNEETKNNLMLKLRKLVKENSYIVQLELNVAFLIRVLGKTHSNENEEILAYLYKKSDSILIRSWVMQVFASWKVNYWFTDLKPRFNTMTKWERKIFLISSYLIGDEGMHWRNAYKRNLSDFEVIIRDWSSEKIRDINWTLPI